MISNEFCDTLYLARNLCTVVNGWKRG